MWRCCIRRSTWLVVIIVAALAAGCVTTPEAPPPASRIAAFSATKPGEPIPPGWGPWSLSRFKSPSRYRLVEDAGTTVLLGDAQASASGLIHYLDVDPGERPLLSWRWKVMALAPSESSPDDSPARIVVSFAGDLKKLPFRRSPLQRPVSPLHRSAAALCRPDVRVGEPHPPRRSRGQQLYLAHQDHRRREREREAGEVARRDAQRRGGLQAAFRRRARKNRLGGHHDRNRCARPGARSVLRRYRVSGGEGTMKNETSNIDGLEIFQAFFVRIALRHAAFFRFFSSHPSTVATV